MKLIAFIALGVPTAIVIAKVYFELCSWLFREIGFSELSADMIGIVAVGVTALCISILITNWQFTGKWGLHGGKE